MERGEVESGPSEGPPLRSLLGAASPASMGRDLEALIDLPEAARGEFWQVLGAYLRPELDEEAQATIVDFCTRHEVPAQRIAAPVKATRFLFQAAARAHLAPDDMVADLRTLAPESSDALAALLVPWFDDFSPQLRRRAAEETIADHGKLVVGTQWRIDRITTSQRGRGLSTSVAMVTFRYREGPSEQRITLQFLPETLAELRRAADEMLG